MKPINTLLMLIFGGIFCVPCLQSQELFKVLALKGYVEARTAQDGWIKISTGYKLLSGEIIRLSENSYAALSYKNGGTIELKRGGEFEANALAKEASSRSSSGVTKKLANYIAAEAGKTKASSADDDHKSNMAVTGSVERATDDSDNSAANKAKELTNQNVFSMPSNPIPFVLKGSLSSFVEQKKHEQTLAESEESSVTMKALFPRNSRIIDSEVTFVWNRVPKCTLYNFTFKNDNEVIYTKTIADTSLIFHLSEMNLKNEMCYYWSISPTNNTEIIAEQSCITVLSDKDKKAICDTVRTIKLETGGETAITEYLLGVFYEQNLLLPNALLAYKKAVQLQPEVEDYKTAYENFLRKFEIWE